MGKNRYSGRNKEINSLKNIYNYYGRRVCHRLSQEKLHTIEKKLPELKLKSNETFNCIKSDFYAERNVILEVGFGMGDNLKFMLDNNPESIFIGCEPYLNGIANLISKLHESDYDRIKIFDKDVRFLLDLVPNNFFSKIVVLFPDPWKKRRHKKRRIFNANNINLFLNKLEKNGEIYFSTDIEDYFLEVKAFFQKKILVSEIKKFYKKPTFLCLIKMLKIFAKKVSPMYLVIKKKVDIL